MRQRSSARRAMARAAAIVVMATMAVTAPVERAEAQVDPSQWGLTSFCTPSQDFPQSRRFRVRNSTGVVQPATLRNQNSGQSVAFSAPVGDSFQLVPAAANPTAANTTQLIVGGVTVQTKAANNKACSVLVGNAVCDTTTGTFDVTWTLRNNGTGPSTITGVSLPGLSFAPNPVPANGTSTAVEDVAGPTSGTLTRTLELTVDLGSSVIGNPAATVTLGQCERPVPPRIGFTFTKTPDVTEVDVGDTITYTYDGTNTGEVPLEVIQLVDDRIGVVISDPTVATIVPPGGSITRSVIYVATTADATVGRIDNAAVVTVIPREGPDREERTATARASVTVRPPPSPSLVGNQDCDPAVPGQATVTWTLANGGPGPALIVSSSRPGVLTSGTVPSGGELAADEVVATPADGVEVLTLTVDVRGADPVTETISVPPCLAPTTDFTFAKTPDVATAEPGDTVTYTYAGTNTGTGPVEVTQLVDDRLGVLISDPSTATIVAPGASISRNVSYVVTADDRVIGEIDNVAVVTVRPTTGPDQDERTGVASARVTVPPLPPAPVVALTGTAVCVPEARSFDITWTLGNSGNAPAAVASASRAGTFAPGTSVPAGGRVDAVEADVPAPTGAAVDVVLDVTFSDAGPVQAIVTLGRCKPELPPVVDFAFDKAADRSPLVAGDTVTYTYTGTNTGEVPIEVIQLVDDRLGIVLYDPSTQTIVPPGETIVRRVTYVVTLDDAALGSIDNIALATIRPDGSDELTAVSEALVEVLPPPEPPPDPDPEPTTTTSTTSPGPTTTTAATTTTINGGGRLPSTGSDAAPVGQVAAILVAAGALAVLATRRPRKR